MSPYEVIYGCSLPSLIDYLLGSSMVALVDNLLTTHTTILQTLWNNLQYAQQCLHQHVGKGHHDISFEIRNWVFLHLQSYLQTSLAHRQLNKLSRHIYRPFKILAWIGLIVYKLNLSLDARLHNVFHISKLKHSHGDPTAQHAPIPI